MEKNCSVYINGEIFSPEKAKISVFDRGFLFGDSIYEATLCIDGIPLFLEEHQKRLQNSANLIQMPLTENLATIKKAILKTAASKNYKRAIVRWIVTRGEDKINIFPGQNLKQNLIIFYKELPPYPERWYKEGLRITLAETKRNHPKSTNPQAKTGNYINSVLAAKEAQVGETDDAIMLNIYGEVTEGTTNNVWIVKKGVVYTPSINSGILKGITRTKVLEICEKNKIPYRETKIFKEDLLGCEEAFITSSTKGLVPIHSIGNQKLTKGYGKITGKINKLYEKVTTDYFKTFSKS